MGNPTPLKFIWYLLILKMLMVQQGTAQVELTCDVSDNDQGLFACYPERVTCYCTVTEGDRLQWNVVASSLNVQVTFVPMESNGTAVSEDRFNFTLIEANSNPMTPFQGNLSAIVTFIVTEDMGDSDVVIQCSDASEIEEEIIFVPGVPRRPELTHLIERLECPTISAVSMWDSVRDREGILYMVSVSPANDPFPPTNMTIIRYNINSTLAVSYTVTITAMNECNMNSSVVESDVPANIAEACNISTQEPITIVEEDEVEVIDTVAVVILVIGVIIAVMGTIIPIIVFCVYIILKRKPQKVEVFMESESELDNGKYVIVIPEQKIQQASAVQPSYFSTQASCEIDFGSKQKYRGFCIGDVDVSGQSSFEMHLFAKQFLDMIPAIPKRQGAAKLHLVMYQEESHETNM